MTKQQLIDKLGYINFQIQEASEDDRADVEAMHLAEMTSILAQLAEMETNGET